MRELKERSWGWSRGAEDACRQAGNVRGVPKPPRFGAV